MTSYLVSPSLLAVVGGLASAFDVKTSSGRTNSTFTGVVLLGRPDDEVFTSKAPANPSTTASNDGLTSKQWITLFVTTAAATTYRGASYRRNYDDSGESFSSYSSGSSYKTPSSSAYSSFGDGRNSAGKRDYNSGFDGDDFIPPIGIQHNNDYSALGDGYQGYKGGGGTGAISYSHVVSEHRPAQRTVVSSQRDGYTSPSHHNHRILAEPTNAVEKPVPVHVKVPFSVVPAFDRSLYPIVNLAPVAPAVIAPVKYPLQFFKPFSYLAPEKHSSSLGQPLPKSHSDPPQYVLTKVPLVYHSSYSETPLGQSGIHSTNFNHNFNHGADSFNRNFNHGTGFNHNFNHGNHNFNHGNHNFNHGNHNFNINPSITTPGTPSFNNFNPPTPLVPTPTPYHHHHH